MTGNIRRSRSNGDLGKTGSWTRGVGLMLGLFLLGAGCLAEAQEPAAVAAQGLMAARRPFDAQAETQAYLDSVPAAAKTRSDAYFEGGYWIEAVGFFLNAGVFWLLLAGRWSAGMRDRAQRLSRFRFLQVFVYWCQFLLVTSLLLFPWAAWTDWYRERQYDLSNLEFTAWALESLKALALGMVLGSLPVIALYAVLRRAPRTWWLWGSGVFIAFLVLALVVVPVFLAPFFNTYTKLEDPKVRDPILSLARANGVGVDAVYQFDASRQSNRISANVSGFLGTDRISLNDNLLQRCSLPEIQAVMGHEIGHYALGHIGESLIFFSGYILLAFAFIRGASTPILQRFGSRWGLRSPDDPATLPLGLLLLSTFVFLTQPILNSYIRINEAEADIFGLNAARQPDGFATVALKLGEYRKLDPGPWEELIFFDHPSGRSRIAMAMRWKAENLPPGASTPLAASPDRPQSFAPTSLGDQPLSPDSTPRDHLLSPEPTPAANQPPSGTSGTTP